MSVISIDRVASNWWSGNSVKCFFLHNNEVSEIPRMALSSITDEPVFDITYILGSVWKYFQSFVMLIQ